MTVRTIYPDYNVMELSEHWDENTRRLVESRLKPPSPPRFFTALEFSILKVVVGRLVDEDNEELLSRVAGQIDEHLLQRQGQGYHKTGVLPGEQLLRLGLAWLDATALQFHQRAFTQLSPWEMDDILGKAQRGEVAWTGSSSKDFFTEILKTAVDFFYSQPEIWSEIGYGGPAFPRGYYRIEYGLKDPWEPRLDKELVEKRAEAGLGPGPVRRVDR
ncbi:gluconate 2-dehydrogenase subunit 3 family protein [Heliobacterium chlorum]|uniref:Gluconate 2-dehydrogenase subunit 3 family protein n=1 Tax=Heliobacterium chlorum TaxID=2698 RepID=A0ABR7SZJ1_HELCL|nr:gluconate 2-dehydrogenase subunit 3 family protein [Heliobacterium chlorum]MBC9783950.1 gluconate 2-dehydrogenase subunit 3 family protein [Heliobacterium chlorum]